MELIGRELRDYILRNKEFRFKSNSGGGVWKEREGFEVTEKSSEGNIKQIWPFSRK